MRQKQKASHVDEIHWKMSAKAPVRGSPTPKVGQPCLKGEVVRFISGPFSIIITHVTRRTNLGPEGRQANLDRADDRGWGAE
jgi:hypothetical protein